MVKMIFFIELIGKNESCLSTTFNLNELKTLSDFLDKFFKEKDKYKELRIYREN